METLGELSKGFYVINNGWKFLMEISNFYLTGCKVLFALRKGKCNPCTLNIALVDVSSLVFALEPLKPDFSRVGIWCLDNGCFERDLAERFLCEVSLVVGIDGGIVGSAPFTGRPIHPAGLFHSLKSLLSEWARPIHFDKKLVYIYPEAISLWPGQLTFSRRRKRSRVSLSGRLCS